MVAESGSFSDIAKATKARRRNAPAFLYDVRNSYWIVVESGSFSVEGLWNAFKVVEE